MIRVAISVEGLTELNFCKALLKPYFYKEYNAHIELMNMGGNISLVRVEKAIKNLLYSHNIVSTLYDYYGFKGKKTKTKICLENSLKDHFKEEKFIPYIQEHEFEALLFSDIEEIAKRLSNTDKMTIEKINELKGILKSAKNRDPEKINDNPSTAPSKRLKNCFSNYDKAFHGPAICENIGLLKIRQECRGFNGWIEKLEQACSNSN